MSKNLESFNTQPLMIEIEGVITRGVKTILNDFMSRYELLERTHNKIMELPSVRNELNRSSPDGEHHAEKIGISNKSINSIIKDTTRNYVREEIGEIEKKLDKILNKIHLLDQEVMALKQVPTDKHVIKPSIVSACENENIQVEIKEKEEDDDDEEDDDEDEKEEDDDDEDEKEEDEDEKEQDDDEKEEDDDDEEDEKEETNKNCEMCNEEFNFEKNGIRHTKEYCYNQETNPEEEEEVIEIEIDDVSYYTNDEENGFIYKSTEDNEVGDKIGYLKEGEPFFYADEK